MGPMTAAEFGALLVRHGLVDAAVHAIRVRNALVEMVRQFAYVSDSGQRSTGGLSTLQEAFAVLGLADPHDCDPNELCDEPGCRRLATCGFPVADAYRLTCGRHHDEY